MRPRAPGQMLGPAAQAAAGLLDLCRRRGQVAALIAGPSGCGKTTLARIAARSLAASDMDLIEINLGACGGVDAMRSVESFIRLASWGGAWKVLVLEEAHNLTPQAQEALLHVVENAPARRAFLFTTTAPGRIIAALRSRLMLLSLPALPPDAMLALLRRASAAEAMPLQPSACQAIVDAAHGNARAALNALDWHGLTGQLPSPADASSETVPARPTAPRPCPTTPAGARASRPPVSVRVRPCPSVSTAPAHEQPLIGWPAIAACLGVSPSRAKALRDRHSLPVAGGRAPGQGVSASPADLAAWLSRNPHFEGAR